MADAVASSSRDRTAQPRTSLHSLHSLHQYDPNQAVVMTDEIIRRRSASGSYFKIVNQYGFKVKVGKGQHGEVFLAENFYQDGAAVVSTLLACPPVPYLTLCPLILHIHSVLAMRT